MQLLPVYETTFEDDPNRLPRWLRSAIARADGGVPDLPFRRAGRKEQGLLPPPRPNIMLVMARMAGR